MNALGVDDYELKEWIIPMGSMPTKRLAHEDFGLAYEMALAHLFELQDGKFSVVVEEGCSCYSPSEAQIEVFPTYEAAKNSFDKWVKAKKENQP